MYAAAGGASLASRQARQRQRQQNNKNRELQQKKLAQIKAGGQSTPTKVPVQSKQFHQLPQNYLRTPNAQARKLSASFGAQSKLLLPISEGNNSGSNSQHSQHPPCQIHSSISRQNLHLTIDRDKHHHHQHHPANLRKSATASIPLVSQAECGTPSATPTICFSNLKNQYHRDHDDEYDHDGKLVPIHIKFPVQPANGDDQIPQTQTTPTTPGPGGGGGGDGGLDPGGVGYQFERKCSVYRGRNLNQFEEQFYNKTTITTTTTTVHDIHVNDEYYGLPNGRGALMGTTAHQKWIDSEYCDSDQRHIGICTCDHIECAQGRAAWLERGRRCSVQENPASCHRRWVKRNRIHDSSLGGSSDDEDLLGVLRGPSSFANAFLYVGLGTVAIGLVIAFVGTGEKGFKTVELRLIGPSLIVIGLVCCILRILFCICPSHCLSSSRRARKKKNGKIDSDHTTSLLRGDSNKRIQIARGSSSHSKLSQLQTKPTISKTFSKTNESVEALRQIATTSLFLQSEQKASTTNRIVPIIKEPEKTKDPPLEMTNIESLSIDICSISDDEVDTDSKQVIPNEIIDEKQSKLHRIRAPINQQKFSAVNVPQHHVHHPSSYPHHHHHHPVTIEQQQQHHSNETILMETSLTIVNPHHQIPSIITTKSSTSSLNRNSNLDNIYPSTSIHIGDQLALPSPHQIQQQPPPPSQQQQQSQSLQITAVAIPSSSTSSEIVLSPANLGQ